MSAFIRLAFWFLLVWPCCAMAQRGYHGKHCVDPDFPSYDIKKISVSVRGSWTGTYPELNVADVANALRKAIRTKGYEVPEEPAQGKGENQADADLVVVFESSQYRGGMKSVGVEARLSLLRGSKKVVYTASGEVRRGGPHFAENEVSDVVDFLPSRPGPPKRKGAR